MASVGEISGEKLGKLGVTIDEEEFGGAVRVWHCYKFNSYNSNNPASFCRGQNATSALPANLYSWLTETICGRKLRWVPQSVIRSHAGTLNHLTAVLLHLVF